MWLGPFDAITLQAAQQPPRALPATRASASRQSVSLEDDLRRVRDGLLHAMVQPAGRKEKAGARANADEPAQVDFATYRQRYLEQQRRMDLMLEPLRSHCRSVLARTSTDLHQLAELDVAMEHILGEREKTLLARLPQCLERRFGHWSGAAAVPLPSESAHDARVQDWVAGFEQDVQQLLSAELEFRLGPIVGLVEAFHNKAMQSQ
jgi:hypothetical protein